MKCSGFDDGPCGKAPQWKDERGGLYCNNHAYLSAICGELTFPIDASEFEMAKWKREIQASAAEILRQLEAEGI